MTWQDVTVTFFVIVFAGFGITQCNSRVSLQDEKKMECIKAGGNPMECDRVFQK